MTRGMYAAAGGMLLGLARQEVLSNNLANVNTPAFRGDRVSFGSYQKVLLPGVTDENGQAAAIYQSATLNPTTLDLRPGALHETGEPLDLGVTGEGWFVLQTPQGERYTRNGHFTRAADGTLISGDGFPVLGTAGPLSLPDSDVLIDEQGNLRSGGTQVGQLRLVSFGDPASVTKDPLGLLAGGTAQEGATGLIRQGRLESSNTDTMRVMVEMVATMRSYEMNQRVIQAQDATIQTTLDTARR
ncbi:MAG: flagellar hook-basal body protein [Fimbriimonadaceae bacterium]|nr:flagellar hook-basal body protein [Fimbriimonadaceae bacterium]